MEEDSWYREPLGDYIATFPAYQAESTLLKGHALALDKWHATTRLRSLDSIGIAFERGLSRSQRNSLAILQEWWTGETQDERVSIAAREALQHAASETNAKNNYLDVDRVSARLSTSRYHSSLFLLFQVEFVHETRMWQAGEIKTFIAFVQAQRERCAQYAAMQRVAHSFAIGSLRIAGNSPTADGLLSTAVSTALISSLHQVVIPACIESCPWLTGPEQRQGLPFYLWDVENKRTVQTSSLIAEPRYTCVSHTWGRWRLEHEPSLSLPGVPWLVPQNSKFSIQSLSDQLSVAFGSGFVWLDLFCIPQNRSDRALMEISRQGAIFGAAEHVVVWLNDASTWDGLRTVLKWLSLVYLRTSNVAENSIYNVEPLDPENEEFFNDAIELYLWDPVQSQTDPIESSEAELSSTEPISDFNVDDLLAPLPWFTSLWTLQEASLRPDMILCDRNWMPLRAEANVLIPLDHIVALNNYVARGMYKKGVPREIDSHEPSGSVDPAVIYRREFSKQYENFNPDDPVEIPGSMDLSTLLTDTCMSDLNWISPAAIFTFGQLRHCTNSRAEAIMSVIGATDWYKQHVATHCTAPPEDGLVLGFYQVDFLNEALSRIGPTFFTAIPTDLRYLRSAVDVAGEGWSLLENHQPVGSMLPFTSSPTYLLPPQKYSFGAYNHPSVKEWTICHDGSVHVTRAGIITPEDLTDESWEQDDMIIAPVLDDAAASPFDSEIETIDGDLKEWLTSFSNPATSPNIAISLYQQIYLSQNIPGPHVGLLLKQVGVVRERIIFVKIGQFYTKKARCSDTQTKDVDWIIL